MARVSRGKPAPAPDLEAGTGREAQRRRTRKAIVEATIGLLGGSRTPSVDEIARAADVSRRTVYLHFPSLDQLLLDATAGALSQADIDAALDATTAALDPTTADGDAVARVDALARGLLGSADDTLPLGRQLVRLTVAPADDRAAGAQPRRGYRRIEWIRRALEPARGRLSEEQFERLVSALSLVLGWEAMIVLRDVCGLDSAEEAATIRWAARALVDAALAEADPSASPNRP